MPKRLFIYDLFYFALCKPSYLAISFSFLPLAFLSYLNLILIFILVSHALKTSHCLLFVLLPLTRTAEQTIKRLAKKVFLTSVSRFNS